MLRIIEILNTLDRPGTDKVIRFMRENNYAGSSCYGHHKHEGGLVDHSLEVYDYMIARRRKLPDEKSSLTFGLVGMSYFLTVFSWTTISLRVVLTVIPDSGL